MELKIKPFHINTFPIGGFFIKDPSVLEWIKEIQHLKFSLKTVEVYPIPNTTANSVWGCLVISSQKIKVEQIGKNELCQIVTPQFFIAEKAIVHPKMTISEIEKLFAKGKYVVHPEFGFVELSEALNLAEFIVKPTLQLPVITKPLPAVFIPHEIRSFQIQPLSPEEILANFEEKAFPKREKMDDTPLNAFEKARLALYEKLLSGGGNNSEGYPSSTNGEMGILSKLESFLAKLLPSGNIMTEKMKRDFEDLAKRNQTEVEKLLDLLKQNPNEALKYAIPLDENGSSRGTNDGELNLSKRWSDLSPLSRSWNTGGGGGAVDLGDHYFALQRQYNETAQALIKEKEYQKAAFVYMKLLKNYTAAAQTLEDGKLYQEAATIYLKHANNKDKAAECYEKGSMISNAIEVYKELNKNEKVGDLYTTIGKKKDAHIYFEKVVDDYKTKDQYVKASLIYKDKIQDASRGQSLLLTGWRANKDAFNCLNNYFENVGDIKTLKNEINTIYKNDLTQQNSETFLTVIQHEFKKKNELSNDLKEMAYEIVAAQIPNNPRIVSELKVFNEKDDILLRDTLLFRAKSK